MPRSGQTGRDRPPLHGRPPALNSVLPIRRCSGRGDHALGPLVGKGGAEGRGGRRPALVLAIAAMAAMTALTSACAHPAHRAVVEPPMPPGVTWGRPPRAGAAEPPPGVPAGAPPAPELRLAIMAGAPELAQPPETGEVWQIGTASFYGLHEQGQETADGERFDYHAMTAASRTLPFGTRVRVTDLATGRSVVVRINDRGPFWTARILDLSAGAARKIGLYRQGLGRVQVEIVSLPDPLPPGVFTVQVGWFHDARRWHRCRQLMRQATDYGVIGFRSSYGRWLRYVKTARLDKVQALQITARLRLLGYPAYIVRLN